MRPQRILLLGAAGQVGHELARSLRLGGEVLAITRQQVDLSCPEALESCLAAFKPHIVVNAAAYTAVDRAESEPERAAKLNTVLPAWLAYQARTAGFRLVHYSTDYVFDGQAQLPYTESSAPRPQGVYGKTKWGGEQAVLELGDQALVLRLSWVFGLHGGNFPKTMIRLAREREQLRVVADQVGCPTPATMVADITLLALRKGLSGLYHVCSSEPTTWHAFAQATLQAAWQFDRHSRLKARPETVIAIATSEYPTPAKRPAYSVLDSSRVSKDLEIHIPSWRPYLEQLIQSMM